MSRSLLAVLALVATTDAFSVRPPPSKLNDAMGRLRSAHLQHGIATTTMRVRALRSSSSEAEGGASGAPRRAAGPLRRLRNIRPPSYRSIRRNVFPVIALLWFGVPGCVAAIMMFRCGETAEEVALKPW